MANHSRLIFSGHEKFQCRHLWLKKGYDFALNKNSFSSDDAVIKLGVGKNMVTSIRYWMRAFDLLDGNDELTDFSHYLFAESGKDKFLEDDASLWLLHYRLIRKNYANTYSLIFNELRKERIEFNKNIFVNFVTNKFKTKISENSISNDFEVFVKLYMTGNSKKDKEEIVSGIFPDLRLLKTIDKGKQQTLYYIESDEKQELPEEVLLFCLLENDKTRTSISLDWLEREYNSPGSIFAINRSGLYKKIEALCEKFDFLVYKDDAGIRELQFKSKPENPYSVLNKYYAN